MSQPETPTPTPSPDRLSPLILWRAAQAFLAIVFDLFGAPEQLVARHTLTLKAYQLCAQWLRAGEALMRRMLFIEAALVAEHCLSSPASGGGDREAIGGGDACSEGKTRAPRQRRLIGFDADKPDAWRVSFRAIIGDTRVPPGARQAGPSARRTCVSPIIAASRFRSAWPLAERLEALLRVVNKPTPYAKRLAARLRKTTALVQRLCASAWSEFRDIIGRTLYNALAHPITCAAAVFGDLS